MARKDVDTLLGFLGHPGRYQMLVFFLLMWQYIPFCFACLSMILFGSKPHGVQCVDTNRVIPVESENFTAADIIFPESCERYLDFREDDAIAKCRKDGDGSVESSKNSSLRLCSDCSRKYQFDSPSENNIISEFDLICEDYWQVGLSTTMAFLGMMVGGPLFGMASDRYGRKPTLLAACIWTLAAGLGVTFASNYILFLIFRFCIGAGTQGTTLCALTLMMESFSKKYREIAGVGAQLTWALGVMLLGAFGYLLQNWRHLQLMISLAVLIAPLYIIFVKESLRWLYVNQRFEEAQDVTNYILLFNGKPKTKKITDCADYLLLWYHKEHEDDDTSNSFLNIFTSAQLRKRVLGMAYIWFIASVWYYVTSFSMSDFFGSKYVNLIAGGAVDLLLTIATIFIVKRFGCRWPMLYTLLAGGACIIIAGFLPDSTPAWHITRTVILQLSRGAAHCVFNMMFPYTADLLPTTIRTVGMGVCSSALRMGGVLAPQALLLGTYISREVPFALCGVMVLIGAFVTFLLPETRGVPLPETMDDLEIQGKFRSRMAMELN